MSNDLTPQNNNHLAGYSSEQIDLIKTQIAKGCNDLELKYFLEICKQANLNPFTKQIYAIKRNTKDGSQLTIQTSIDGYRAIAHQSGKCLSISDPIFEYSGDRNNIPISATITVKKIVGNHIGEFTSTAYWSDYYGDGKSYMANSKPRIMLGKCAESLALRKAFPSELSGLYTQEEMIIADREEIQIEKDKIVDVKITERENNRDEFDSMIDFINKTTKEAWPKLNENQRKSLFADTLKISGIKELSKKSFDELTKVHIDFCNFIAST
jgi:phage recombination protein Bet